MAIQQLDYEPRTTVLEGAAKALIDEADSRFDDFYAKGLNKRYSRYVASEPDQVYAAFQWLAEEGLAPGDSFLEWGSGFGVATGLAALLGYTAQGIELRRGLVNIARELMESQQIDADFLCTSYIPEGYIEFDSADGEDLIVDDSFGYSLETPPVYSADGLEIEIGEIDVFYVYPWPGQQSLMLKLFDEVAGEDALLVAYYGDMDICIYRKL